MESLYRIEDMVCKELDDIASTGEINMQNLDAIDKMVHIKKNIAKINQMEAEEYSGAGDWTANGTYGNGYSGARGHYVRGHYSMADGAEMMRGRMNDRMYDDRMSGADRMTMQRGMDRIARY